MASVSQADEVDEADDALGVDPLRRDACLPRSGGCGPSNLEPSGNCHTRMGQAHFRAMPASDAFDARAVPFVNVSSGGLGTTSAN